MKDPIGLIFALIIAGYGASALFYPQWYYHTKTLEQAARDRKRVRIIGSILLPVGLMLLAIHFYK
jgi:uncharacterized membrane protein